jgi:hypothetical protein
MKRVFGGILTVGGIAALIYAGSLFMNTGGNNRDIRGIFIFAILGLIFFFAGIALVKRTKDEV